MNRECEERDAFGMSIGSPDFIQERAFRGFLVIPEQESSRSSVAKKNSLWFLRHDSLQFLRLEGPPGSGSVLRGQEDLPGDGNPACLLPEVPDGEAGKACLAVRQPLLHEEVRLYGGETLPGHDDYGRGKRVSSRLEDGQGVGQAVHAGAVEEDGNTGSSGHRDRRDIDPERAHLSDCGERPDKTACDRSRGRCDFYGFLLRSQEPLPPLAVKTSSSRSPIHRLRPHS